METETWTSKGAAADARAGLMDSPKWLSSLYFYDKRGSELFDAICQTAEYYPTRTEHGILMEHANEILAAAGDGLVLAELGSGSSDKTRVLLRALTSVQGASTYLPVDVSEEFLESIAVNLREEHPQLKVEPIAAEYADGLEAIGKHPATRRLVLFLGSSIGNFEPEEQVALLKRAHDELSPGDAFLLGTDLVKKVSILESAYNDTAGLTAAFNQNILNHLNDLLDGDADPSAFKHVAFWNASEERIEMHLESLADQTLTFRRADLSVDVAQGERIHTENSYKFTPQRAKSVAEAAGFTLEQRWTDADGWFALSLLRV